MDPFGDNSDSGDLNAFQPPADASSYSNDFYEVDSGEAPTDAAPADSFSFGDNDDAPAAAAPAQHDDMDLNASYSQDDFASSSGSRTTSFEHQQTSHSASHSANHSASNSRHSSFQAAASASGGSRTSSFGQSGAGASSIPVIEEENELTKFMREYEQRIADKAQEQAKVALESKDKAQSDMAQFVNERSRIKESKQQANRVHEQATLEKLAADLEAENPWERVVSLVELEANRKQKLAALQAASSSKSKDVNAEPPKATKKSSSNDDDEDVSRMRQLFVQLKAEPLEQTRGAIATH